MIIKVEVNDQWVEIDLSMPMDISIPIEKGDENPNAYNAPLVDFIPVRTDEFVGSIEEGGIINFKNIRINPHGNGTHTECVGHIAQDSYTINQCLKEFHFLAQLITIDPIKLDHGDSVITKDQLSDIELNENVRALIIRTMPNDETKMTRNYLGTNPPYVLESAMEWIVEQGIEHLVLDLPSVDREEDEGKFLAHKAFWKYPSPDIRLESTITELAYIPDEVDDGAYLLNIQIASFELDASPSKLVLFQQMPSDDEEE